jgi:hypothetical protein
MATIFQFVGAWIRSLTYVTGTFAPILVGTCIMSLSGSALLQVQNIIINKWFPVSEYGLASGIIGASTIATVFGLAATGIYFSSN